MSLVLYPNPMLKEKSKLIVNSIPDDKNLQKLINKMVTIMDTFNGVGLSAIQIGVPLNLFVLRVNGVRQVVINPSIITVSKEFSYENEGCLSAPAVYTRIRRPEGLSVKFMDETGTMQERTYTGLMARAFQHEYDHLCGVTFFDRMNTIQRAAALKKYKKITDKIPKEYFEQATDNIMNEKDMSVTPEVPTSPATTS